MYEFVVSVNILRIFPSLRFMRLHQLLSHDQQLAVFTVAPVRTSHVYRCVVSVEETTQQHLYPSPAPGTAEPSNRIYIKMKPPICVEGG